MDTLQTGTMNKFEQIGNEVGKLVAEKNAAYGDSFAKAGEFLLLLYPDGIKPDQYGDALAMVRIFDKQMRIATRKTAFGESPYRDIAGYGVLGVAKDSARVPNYRQAIEEQQWPRNVAASMNRLAPVREK